MKAKITVFLITAMIASVSVAQNSQGLLDLTKALNDQLEQIQNTQSSHPTEQFIKTLSRSLIKIEIDYKNYEQRRNYQGTGFIVQGEPYKIRTAFHVVETIYDYTFYRNTGDSRIKKFSWKMKFTNHNGKSEKIDLKDLNVKIINNNDLVEIDFSNLPNRDRISELVNPLKKSSSVMSWNDIIYSFGYDEKGHIVTAVSNFSSCLIADKFEKVIEATQVPLVIKECIKNQEFEALESFGYIKNLHKSCNPAPAGISYESPGSYQQRANYKDSFCARAKQGNQVVPGMSGGPAVNANGELVGVNQAVVDSEAQIPLLLFGPINY